MLSRSSLIIRSNGTSLAQHRTSTTISNTKNLLLARTRPLQQQQKHAARRGQATASTAISTKQGSLFKRVFDEVKKRPLEYASIPCVAAFVGITTNWMGVKFLFYPIQYVGIDLKQWPDTPYGMFGWQGVVPSKTVQMAERLVKVVTERLLSLDEAFGRLEPQVLSNHLLPAVQDAIYRDCGVFWAAILRPVLPMLLTRLLTSLQNEIDDVLDLRKMVMSAFVRDKVVLVDLFQKVGRVELEFLVNSGFGFGALLGLAQMAAWVTVPAPWTLPVAGSLVGFITNWIAIKMLFEPAEPVNVANLFVLQGLFESRQVEVSDEFGAFLEKRVLDSSSLLDDLSNGGDGGALYAFLRKHLPYPIPGHILSAAVSAIQEVAQNEEAYPELHEYVTRKLDIEATLARRLKTLPPTDFEDMLHPVFQENEIILIATGGLLGLIAGTLQTKLGWGGPSATRRALLTIVGTLAASAAFYLHQKHEAQQDEPLASKERPEFHQKVTLVQPGSMKSPLA